MTHTREQSSAGRTAPAPALRASSIAGVEPGSLPVRAVSGTFWRQCGPRYGALETPPVALGSGRYHRKDEQPCVYASSTREAAWGELFRHVYSGVSPFEVKRRVAELQVTNLPVLDLTDSSVLARLGVQRRQLVANNYAICQQIADLAREGSDQFGGLLAPSAADPRAQTLVVFPEWRERVRVRRSRVGRAPMRLVGLFEQIVGTLPVAAQDEAYALLNQARRELHRIRRRVTGRR